MREKRAPPRKIPQHMGLNSCPPPLPLLLTHQAHCACFLHCHPPPLSSSHIVPRCKILSISAITSPAASPSSSRVNPASSLQTQPYHKSTANTSSPPTLHTSIHLGIRLPLSAYSTLVPRWIYIHSAMYIGNILTPCIYLMVPGRAGVQNNIARWVIMQHARRLYLSSTYIQ